MTIHLITTKTMLLYTTMINSYTVSQKNDTDVAYYSFDEDQPILIIFGRDIADRVCYQMVICYPISPN